MTSKVFFISDTHFSHANICKFLDHEGNKVRPWDDPREMDEFMVERWNEVVRPQDKVYHLGDVVINRSALPILDRLNGKKVLIKGNHDIFKIDEYAKYFYDVRACHVIDGKILSHIPIHPHSLSRWNCNVHGHLHTHSVYVDADKTVIDPRYFCVCVEQIEYAPLCLSELNERIKRRQNDFNEKTMSET